MYIVKKCRNLFVFVLMSSVLASCGTSYSIAKMEGTSYRIDSSYDANVDAEMLEDIEEYKVNIEREMSPVIGEVSEPILTENRSYNMLANVISDIIKLQAERIDKQKIDMGMVNIGGMRRSLPAGNITVGLAYELLPFMNTLCIMDMKGDVLLELFEQIAFVGGEGISSGVVLTISKDGKLLDAKVDGQPVDKNKTYRIATIDYIAEGNDGMTAYKKATNKIFPEDALLRDLFIDYVKELTAQGKKLEPKKDHRFIIK